MANAKILKIKNEQGEWIDIPAIKGDAGPQGPVGPQGPKGDQGEVTTQQMTDYVSQELASKQDKLDSYSDSASVAEDKLTINYKVKQEDGTYSNVPVEFSGGSKYTFTNGLTETDGTVSWDLNNIIHKVSNNSLKIGSDEYNYILFDGFDIRLRPNLNGVYPVDYYDVNLGANSSSKMFNNAYFKGTLQAANLSDGTTTKTMTEVLSGTTEAWTFTLSDGTTVVKNVKVG